MTIFEHAMLGVTLALAGGFQRRERWPIVLMAGAAAAMPDWDGLTLLAGGEAYSAGHRVWGHNLLLAGGAGALCGILGYLCQRSGRVRPCLDSLALQLEASPVGEPAPLAWQALATWTLLGALAGLSHLPADLIYSGGSGMADWPLPLLWPFSQERWVWPIVPWGDLGATLIFIAEMFALYRWPTRAQAIAALTLLTLAAYIGLRACLG